MTVQKTAQRVPAAVVDDFQERFDCWNRGELDEMLAMYAEDAVFDVSGVFVDTPPVQGHDRMRRHWDDAWETWGGLRMDVRDVFDAGDNRYAVDVRLWGQGKRSGAEVDQRLAFLYTLRPGDDLILRAELLPDLEAALARAARSRSAS